jgi:uncharacterized protein (DUF305 family)
MADMAIDKGGNAKVLALAKDIKGAQGPKIAQMSGGWSAGASRRPRARWPVICPAWTTAG